MQFCEKIRKLNIFAVSDSSLNSLRLEKVCKSALIEELMPRWSGAKTNKDYWHPTTIKTSTTIYYT